MWGVNTVSNRDFSHPLPLGLTNQTNETEFHTLFGDVQHLARADIHANFPNEFTARYSARFSTNTNPKVRVPLYHFLNQSFGPIDNTDFSEKGRISYLRDLRESNFVICPEGNGTDTHRIWETLYMGGFPVLLNNDDLSPLLSGLPVVILSKWSQLIDLKFMEAAWWNLMSRNNYDYNKLYVGYWLSKIHA